jgi:hypothetical protein
MSTRPHLEPGHPVEEECCAEWARAHLMGSDCEALGALVYYDVRWPRSSTETSAGKPVIGTDLMPVRYCPWCAAAKTKGRRARR